MSDYQLTANPDFVVRTGDGATIPVNSNTIDASGYQTWLAAGNTPAPVPAPPTPTVQQQIAALEALQTPRLMRDVAIGSTTLIADIASPLNGMSPSAALAYIETQIATLRAGKGN